MVTVCSAVPGSTVNHAGADVSKTAATPVTPSLIIEPEAGADRYLKLIGGAKKQIDVNSYLLTDRAVVGALTQATARKVTVRILIAGNPYDAHQAVAQEQAEFAGTQVQMKLAAARFEGQTFDHAKYLVADPGTPAGAGILGSSNLTASGLGAGNREFDVATTDPATVAAMATVFTADWTGTAAGSGSRAQLILSSGAEGALLNLIDNAKARILIETEGVRPRAGD